MDVFNDGDIEVSNDIDGAQDLTVDAGSGSVDIYGAIGSTVALGDVTINAHNIYASNNIYAQSIMATSDTQIVLAYMMLDTSAADGDVTLSANASGSASGSFDGIVIESSEVFTGDGDITLTGRAGQSGGIGVSIYNSEGDASLNTDGGTISITGQGPGSGFGSDDYGVEISAATISSSSGDISITGMGNTGSYSHGIYIDNAAQITTGASGSITLDGSATDSYSVGVSISGSGTLLQTDAGDITIEGVSSLDDGIIVEAGAVIESASGNITLTGDSGFGSGYSGIHLVDAATTIGGASTSGDIYLIADSFDLAGGSIETSGALYLKNYTDSNNFEIGSTAGISGLDSAELALISGISELHVGSSSMSGNITVSDLSLWGLNTFTTDSGDITFTVGLNGFKELSVVSNSGNIGFDQNMGQSVNLAATTVNTGGTFTHHNIIAGGNQSYTADGGILSQGLIRSTNASNISFNSPITLQGDLTLRGINGNAFISVADTVSGSYNLTIEASSGGVNLQGAISVLDFTATATGASAFDLGADINASGDITMSGLSGGVRLTKGSGSTVTLTANGAIDLSSTAITNFSLTGESLTLVSSGDVTTGSINLGGFSGDGDLDITFDTDNNGSNTATIGAVADANSIHITGVASGAGDTIALTDNLLTSGGDITIGFAEDVTIDASANRSLSATGNIDISSTIANGITLVGGSGTVSMTALADGDIMLTNITDDSTGGSAASLELSAGHDISVGAISLVDTMQGSFSAEIDADDDEIAIFSMGGTAQVYDFTLGSGGGTNDTFDIDYGITAANSISFSDADSVELDVSTGTLTLTAGSGGIDMSSNISLIMIESGSGHVGISTSGDGDIALGDLASDGASFNGPDLLIGSTGSVDLSSVDLSGSGSSGNLTVEVDTNDNEIASLNVSGSIENVYDLAFSGSASMDDIISLYDDITLEGALEVTSTDLLRLSVFDDIHLLANEGMDLSSTVNTVELFGGAATAMLETANDYDIDLPNVIDDGVGGAAGSLYLKSSLGISYDSISLDDSLDGDLTLIFDYEEDSEGYSYTYSGGISNVHNMTVSTPDYIEFDEALTVGGRLSLITSSYIDQYSAPITAPELLIEGGADVYLDDESNMIGALAADVTFISLTTATDLVIGTLGGVSGITSEYDVAIRALGSDIILNDPIVADVSGEGSGYSTIVLNAQGDIVNNVGSNSLDPGTGTFLAFSLTDAYLGELLEEAETVIYGENYDSIFGGISEEQEGGEELLLLDIQEGGEESSENVNTLFVMNQVEIEDEQSEEPSESDSQNDSPDDSGNSNGIPDDYDDEDDLADEVQSRTDVTTDGSTDDSFGSDPNGNEAGAGDEAEGGDSGADDEGGTTEDNEGSDEDSDEEETEDVNTEGGDNAPNQQDDAVVGPGDTVQLDGDGIGTGGTPPPSLENSLSPAVRSQLQNAW